MLSNFKIYWNRKDECVWKYCLISIMDFLISKISNKKQGELVTSLILAFIGIYLCITIIFPNCKMYHIFKKKKFTVTIAMI
ncbi:hypothetical protein MPUT_0115 [Mycoplasma putrefaciens KS1]|uniref:Uncharacterized protein n=1 Tax=Mycoplasma putrefaciens (strain ATCC 15718 / NCTC 10155 / C30 KS-1 / KS-1) TaxID=743965 RepID=A0A7U4E9G3_MYCPK|nr:hypothetical protein MPUT_0115 [Mycoplasma putrefaciens KS1]